MMSGEAFIEAYPSNNITHHFVFVYSTSLEKKDRKNDLGEEKD